jgi:hypothetical protein
MASGHGGPPVWKSHHRAVPAKVKNKIGIYRT